MHWILTRKPMKIQAYMARTADFWAAARCRFLGTGELPELTCPHTGTNYRHGINKGLYKIISKMGISTIASYRGAQLFEIVGLHRDVVDMCFTGTTNRLDGKGFDELEAEQKKLHWISRNPRKTTSQGGLLKYVHGGEYHAYNPDVVHQANRFFPDFAAAGHDAFFTDAKNFVRTTAERYDVIVDFACADPPTCSTPSTSHQIAASRDSTSLRGATNTPSACRWVDGAGSASRSTLPFGLSFRNSGVLCSPLKRSTISSSALTRPLNSTS